MHIFEDEYFSIFLIFCILQGLSLFVHYLIFFFFIEKATQCLSPPDFSDAPIHVCSNSL